MKVSERIIVESNRLFVSRGIKSVTMDIIAQELGMSKRTIYENFKDKNSLVDQCVAYAIGEHRRKMMQILEQSKNVIESLVLIGDYNRRIHLTIHPSFFLDMKKFHKKIFEKISENGEYHDLGLMLIILRRGVNEGFFSKEINLELASRFISRIMTFFHEVCERSDFNQNDFSRTIMYPYIRGLCTPKGLEQMDKIFLPYFENQTNN